MNIENEIQRLKRIVYFLERKIGGGDSSLSTLVAQLQQDIIDLQNSLIPDVNTGTYATGQIIVNILSGLDVQVIWPIYYINNVEYAAGSDTITLDAADVTDDRFDAVILNSTGLDKITGTASATPEQPTIDTTSELLVTYIFVQANQTDLNDGDIIVYNEGTETTVTSNATIDDQSTAVSPIVGTYVLSLGSFNQSNYIDFTFASPQSIADVTDLKYFVRLITTFSNITYFTIKFYNGASIISNTVNVVDGSFNFNRSTIGTFQSISIPIGSFTFTEGNFDKIRIAFRGGNTSGFYLDYFRLQKLAVNNQLPQNFFKTILDDTGQAVSATQPNDILQIKGSTKTGTKELSISGGSGTVTSVAALTLGTTGTDLSSSVSNPTTTPVITLNVPTASASNRGVLSSTDWSTFNSKQAALGFTPENVSNKSDSYTVSSSTTYASTKAVVDGLSNKQNTLTNPVTGTGTTNEISYFTGASTIGSLSTATYPSLTELSSVKGVTSAIQTQFTGKQATLVSGTNIKTINGSSILGSGDLSITPTGAWLLASGGTLTGANTITSNSPNQLLWNGTWTATANDQYHEQVSPSITATATASDRLFALNIAPTLIAGANTQTLAALQLNPTFTNGAFTGVGNYALWIRNGSIAGPNNAALAILTVAPTQATSSVAGNAVTINASNATGGTTGNNSASGGAVSITAGNSGGVGNGGGGGGLGGNVNITAGNNTAGYTGGAGGNIVFSAGDSSTNVFGARMTIQGAQTSAITGGSVSITGGTATQTGGSISITGGTGGSGNNIGGNVTISSGSGGITGNILITTTTGGSVGGNIVISTGTAAGTSGAIPNISLTTGSVFEGRTPGTISFTTGSVPANNNAQTGSFVFTTGNGNSSPTSIAQQSSGGFTVNIGKASSVHASFSGTGGNAGSISFNGGTGGDALTTSLGGTGGIGSNIVFTSGTGGAATGSSGARVGGASGSISFITASGGTGATANGAVGSILFKVNVTTTLFELAYNSGAGKIGLFNATPVAQPTTAGASATRVGGGGTTLTDTDTFDGYTFAQIVKGLRNLGAFA